MDKRKDILKELEEIAPKLGKIEKKDPFKVPVNYFEGLQREIQETVTRQKSSFSLWDMAQYILEPKYSVSFGILLIIAIGGYIYLQPTTSFDFNSELSLIESADISDYIINNIDDFEEDMIYEDATAFLDESVFIVIDSTELDSYINDFIIDEIDNQTLQEELL